MSLEHAILVSLAEWSASGYDLARRFDISIGHVWRASHQQIYKVLGRMEKGGIVSAAVVKQDDWPDKRVHQISTTGRHELRDWTGLPTPVQILRSDFAAKILGMQFGGRGALVTDIGWHRDAH